MIKKTVASDVQNDTFSGFSQLNQAQRLKKLSTSTQLTLSDVSHLKHTASPSLMQRANEFIENSIGCFALPLGVAPHFCIDQKNYIIPMAVEESSVIAAASGTAKWVKQYGTLSTNHNGNTIIGQIQFDNITNWKQFQHCIEQKKAELITQCNQEIAANLMRRGGGVKGLTVHKIPNKFNKEMAVIHVLLNPCDAMGANAVTQVCEYLKKPLEKITGESVALCILSNRSDIHITQATIVLHNIDSRLADGIVNASHFAESDPYRAATHNKGIMNGIDALLIATGNDWRAVEAGVHAYAAREGRYKPISIWRYDCKTHQLMGELKAPIAVGVVGGVTRLHPTAQLALKLLDITRAEQLSRIAAALGLVQNLAALRALTTTGILQGHLKLHQKNRQLHANIDHARQQ